MGCKWHKVVNLCGVYLIKLNHLYPFKKTGAINAPAAKILTYKAEIHLLIKFSLVEPRYTRWKHYKLKSWKSQRLLGEACNYWEKG